MGASSHPQKGSNLRHSPEQLIHNFKLSEFWFVYIRKYNKNYLLPLVFTMGCYNIEERKITLCICNGGPMTMKRKRGKKSIAVPVDVAIFLLLFQLATTPTGII
jgi:hypothetical protein